MAIVCILQDDSGEESRTHPSLSGFTFTGSPRIENLQTLVAHFDIPDKQKTVGVLYRGSQLPPVAAMSGWIHQDNPDANIQIAGRTWTEEVRRLCKTVGHDLPSHDYDQTVPGQYNACHAEKQLIAYFLHKHLFLYHELEESISPPGIRLSEEDTEADDAIDNDMKIKLSALKNVEPPNTLKEATVMVSTEVCQDCEDFKDMVNQVLGTRISLFHRCLSNKCRQCKGYRRSHG